MLLGGMIRFIDRASKESAGPALKQVLAYTRQLLMESDDGRNSEKLRQGLLYLQGLSIEQGFLSSPRPLALELKERGYTCLPMDAAAKKLVVSMPKLETVFSEDDASMLGSLYVGIMRHYKPLAWSYTYPLDETGQVMNDAVGQWQAGRMELASSNQAYRDYMRDTRLAGMSGVGASDAQIEKAIGAIAANASGYASEDKGKLVEWLKKNGGQDNNRFLDFMLMQGHLSEVPYALLKSKAIEQNWQVENGKICFNYDVLVSSVGNPGEDAYLYATKEGQAAMTKNPEVMKKALEVGQKDLPPYLMRVTAKIELGIDGANVVPKITTLNVRSYTDKLLSPERLFSQEQALGVISTRRPT